MNERLNPFAFVTRPGALAAWTVVLLLLVACIKAPYNIYDEGLQSVAALRILRGDAPYRDFWLIYPPGQLHILAGVYWLFGESVAVARAYDLVVRLLICVAIYLLGRRVAPASWSLAATVLAALVVGTTVTYGTAVSVALCLVLWALVALLAFATSRQQGWVCAAGVLIGVAAIFRYDFAAYGAAAASGALGMAWLAARRAQNIHGEAIFTICKGRHLLLFAGAAVSVALGAYALSGARYGFAALWDQVFAFPLRVLPPFRILPMPSLLGPLLAISQDGGGIELPVREAARWVQWYVPLMVHGTGAALAAWLVWRRKAWTNADLALALVALLGLLTSLYASLRFDTVHIAPSTTLVGLTLMLLLVRVARIRAKSLRHGLMAGALAFALLAVALPSYRIVAIVRQTPPWGCDRTLAQSNCVAVIPDQAQAVAFIQQHTTPDERIFVGLARHDRIFIQDLAFYHLANRASATGYHHLEAGFAITKTVQEWIIADLEADATQWIVLLDRPNPGEPNLSAVSSGVFLLDNYIAAHYEPVTRFDRYAILQLNDSDQ